MHPEQVAPAKFPLQAVQSVAELQAEHEAGQPVQTKVTPEPVPKYPPIQLSHSIPVYPVAQDVQVLMAVPLHVKQLGLRLLQTSQAYTAVLK